MESTQHEQYEYARQRIKQKKKLYFHFVLLFLGSILLFVLNKILNIGEPTNWYLWIITLWVFIFILNFIKVFVTDSFMNKNWERTQIDKLITQQQRKIEQLQTKVVSDLETKNNP
jgi:Zn-dependent protease with chaperone function